MGRYATAVRVHPPVKLKKKKKKKKKMIAQLKPAYKETTFASIMTPTRQPAAAVVIGPISVFTADILEAGSSDNTYAL